MNIEERKKWAEEEFDNIHKDIRNNEALSHYDFLRIMNFKTQIFTTETEKNIKKITKEAFKLAEKDKIEKAIKLLIGFYGGLYGVGMAIASTILAIKFPHRYAIIDKKVLNQLNKKEWLKEVEKPETYKKYLILMRKNAKEKGMKLRDYERNLFEK